MSLGTTDRAWTPESWRDKPAAQQPSWPDPGELDRATAELRALPPLVFAGEARRLRDSLADVAHGNAFVLQAGDCAESFAEFTADSIRDKLKVILQMAVVLTYGTGVPVVKVGRIAGQFAKPRSSDSEEVRSAPGGAIPSFRGHMVNGDEPTAEARVPDPRRMIRAYHQSASTLNLLRAFTHGGFADLTQVHAWNQQFVSASEEGRRYDAIAAEIERALRFMAACGIDLAAEANLHQVELYTMHEALILAYEEALTRKDSLTGDWYDCSAHMVWVGERTRQLEGAHLEFVAGIHNPVGMKIGPTASPADVLEICEKVDPHRTPGRLTLITRMGASKVRTVLPPILEAVRRSSHPAVWVCDPMHGNTFLSDAGMKTRRFDDILDELKGFFEAHRKAGTWPGGVHVELTGDDVTECIGGEGDVTEAQLGQRYTTACDPRLNAKQSIDLAFRLAELLRS